MYKFFLKLFTFFFKLLLKYHHDAYSQSDQSEAFLFQYKSIYIEYILYRQIIDEEADEPLKDPHLIGQADGLYLAGKFPAFFLEERPKERAIEAD